MGKARGINSGGGESSLGYLFGSGKSVSKPTKPAVNTSFTTTTTTPTTTNGAGGRLTTTTTTNTITGDKNMTEEEKKKEMSAGVRGSPNNYLRTEGQNCGSTIDEGSCCTWWRIFSRLLVWIWIWQMILLSTTI
ncbi:protein SPIRAL1-like 4 isoform X2 [Brassica napus]|uniref:protein SPIRAL1-like 4 isoform X2 n=1 Tax=Brassica napus TaxID=3708 RepID=UPI000BBE9812|nr:protein SPIRAL1-like 4 isoform X2 [Brassica napus]